MNTTTLSSDCGLGVFTLGSTCSYQGLCVLPSGSNRSVCQCFPGYDGLSDFKVTTSETDCQQNQLVIRILYGSLLLSTLLAFPLLYYKPLSKLYASHLAMVKKAKAKGQTYTLRDNRLYMSVIPFFVIIAPIFILYSTMKLIDTNTHIGAQWFATILFVICRPTTMFISCMYETELLRALLKRQDNAKDIVDFSFKFGIYLSLAYVFMPFTLLLVVHFTEQDPFYPIVGLTTIGIFFVSNIVLWGALVLHISYVERVTTSILTSNAAMVNDPKIQRISVRLQTQQGDFRRQSSVQLMAYLFFACTPFMWRYHDYFIAVQWHAILLLALQCLRGMVTYEDDMRKDALEEEANMSVNIRTEEIIRVPTSIEHSTKLRVHRDSWFPHYIDFIMPYISGILLCGLVIVNIILAVLILLGIIPAQVSILVFFVGIACALPFFASLFSIDMVWKLLGCAGVWFRIIVLIIGIGCMCSVCGGVRVLIFLSQIFSVAMLIFCDALIVADAWYCKLGIAFVSCAQVLAVFVLLQFDLIAEREDTRIILQLGDADLRATWSTYFAARDAYMILFLALLGDVYHLVRHGEESYYITGKVELQVVPVDHKQDGQLVVQDYRIKSGKLLAVVDEQDSAFATDKLYLYASDSIAVRIFGKARGVRVHTLLLAGWFKIFCVLTFASAWIVFVIFVLTGILAKLYTWLVVLVLPTIIRSMLMKSVYGIRLLVSSFEFTKFVLFLFVTLGLTGWLFAGDIRVLACVVLFLYLVDLRLGDARCVYPKSRGQSTRLLKALSCMLTVTVMIFAVWPILLSLGLVQDVKFDTTIWILSEPVNYSPVNMQVNGGFTIRDAPRGYFANIRVFQFTTELFYAIILLMVFDYFAEYNRIRRSVHARHLHVPRVFLS